MPDKKDDRLQQAEVADAEVIDLGDAIVETKQLSPFGNWPDCQFNVGQKPGCGLEPT